LNSADEARSTLDEAERFANTLAGKTARELGELEVGEVQFTGRDRWELKLAAARDKLVKATLAAVDACSRSMGIWSAKSAITLSPDERLQLQEAQNAIKTQIANLRLERYRFDQIVADGIKSASELQRERNK
jgi:predicted LPLAT superfamily acyltransferase